MKAEHIIENDLKSVGANSHSNAWNQLASYIIRNETDKINRSTVIQYCNVIQGESGKQVFLDRESFDAMVKTVKSKKLRVDEDILEIQDPVKPRRDARDLLRNVLDKLEHVKEEELEKAEALMSVIRESFEIDDIDDEDVVELVDKVEFFYDTAQTGKLPLKYNQELFENVRKYSKSISQGVREIANAQNRTDTLECILAFSQDPIRKVERLVQLLNKVTTDIDKAQKEIEARKTKYGSTRKSAGDRYVFAEEEKSISQCMEMIERLEAASC